MYRPNLYSFFWVSISTILFYIGYLLSIQLLAFIPLINGCVSKLRKLSNKTAFLGDMMPKNADWCTPRGRSHRARTFLSIRMRQTRSALRLERFSSS